MATLTSPIASIAALALAASEIYFASASKSVISHVMS